ncbi:Fic family protein [Candidatus Gracilibacteria bacterium]|nr:Fic family protein [Candidatus Gracilibacteria bacterium]
MQLLRKTYLENYKKQISLLKGNIESFLATSGTLDFDYLTEASSVFSSNIEGNSLDLNSFMNAKKITQQKTKDVEEIEHLIEAYHFAQTNDLTEENFLKIHSLSSKTLLIESKQGKYREEPVGVFSSSGLIYMAIEHENVALEMKKLFTDIASLLEQSLSDEEVFYYASMIHLVFVHIHPFSDGNGRTARILEKWFLTQKLGRDFWNISSEEYYWNHRKQYYDNINLGVNYYELNYEDCMEFLLMLPKSLEK